MISEYKYKCEDASEIMCPKWFCPCQDMEGYYYCGQEDDGSYQCCCKEEDGWYRKPDGGCILCVPPHYFYDPAINPDTCICDDWGNYQGFTGRNGAFVCCEEGYQGYEYDATTSACCPKDGHHKITGLVYGAGGSFIQACCDTREYGSNPTAYWNGNSAQCCKGDAYKSNANGYGCCDTTNGAYVVVDVEGAPTDDLQICCSTSTYGSNPTAFWNGSSAQCCNGVAQCITHEGKQVCRCCPDGETLYSYYAFREYDTEGNITASLTDLYCCTNNPMTSLMTKSYWEYDDGSLALYEEPVCCQNSAPLVDVWFESSDGEIAVTCTSDKYNITIYEGRYENVWYNYYGYCPNGVEEWTYVNSSPEDPYYERGRNCL